MCVTSHNNRTGGYSPAFLGRNWHGIYTENERITQSRHEIRQAANDRTPIGFLSQNHYRYIELYLNWAQYAYIVLTNRRIAPDFTKK